jgi:putative CocE/NonD family hydrolase
MIALVAAAALATPGRPPRTDQIADRDVADVAARDGTTLHTVVWRPQGPGPWPTVVTRVPYGMDLALDWQCRLLVRRGFACVYQHVRGRGRSGGAWSPFVNEEHDGQDTIAWIRAQSWSNGRIGWLGDSYLAATGWTVALQDPDGLTTLVSRVFAPSLYLSAYEDGLLRHELVTAWMALMPDERNRLLGVGQQYRRALAHRPRTTLDEIAAGHPVPWYREWLEAEDLTAPAWARADARGFQGAAETTTIPVLLIGGWSDAFIAAELDVWSRLASREHSLLVVGPWAHLGQKPSSVHLGGVAERGDGPLVALQIPRVLDWLEAHLSDTPARYPQSGAITYVVGGDRWEYRPIWPPPTAPISWSIRAGPDRCSGRLAASAAPLAAPLTWTYDPEHPLASHGGDGMLAGAIPTFNGVKPGFVRAPDLCRRREDVLRFHSAPLDRPLHLAGAIRVEMDVASDAEDTAFGFRLLEHRHDGTEFLLREGFATLALRNGAPRTPYHPGDVVHVSPDATPLEAEVHAGSSLVLVLTSSSFPSYEAHPNVAGLLSAATETRVAHQQVLAATLVIPEVQ